MDILDAHKAIQQRWLDQWPTLHPDIPFVFDNDAKPESPVFARVAIVSGTSDQYSLGREGNRQWQYSGYIEIRLTGLVGAGRAPLDRLAKSVIQIYRGRRLGVRRGEHGVVTYAATLGELRRDAQSARSWLMTVTIPYEFYERS